MHFAHPVAGPINGSEASSQLRFVVAAECAPFHDARSRIRIWVSYMGLFGCLSTGALSFIKVLTKSLGLFHVALWPWP
jgi:hypothetical protein